MKPRTAERWVDAYLKLQKIPGVPPLVLQETEKKYRAAMRTAVPAKPRIRLPRGVKAKIKKASLPKLKRDLDRVFSLFIRQKLADPNGMVACVTCGKVYHWKELDAGHYVPRQDMATRWDESNVWPQCRPENAFRGGEPEKMAAYIDETCGRGTAENLRAQARLPFKLHRQWLEAKIASYKGMIHD